MRLQELSHKIQKIIRKTKTDVTYRFKQLKQKAKDEKIRSSKEFQNKLDLGFERIDADAEETKKEVHKLNGLLKRARKADDEMRKGLVQQIEEAKSRSKEDCS